MREIAEADNTIKSILGESVINGIWKPPKHMQIKNVLGSTVIDFTDARLSPGITEIDMMCVLGSIEMIVPKNIRIKMQCSAILGESRNRSPQPDTENVPVVVLKGYVILGELNVHPKKESILKKILKKFGLD